MLSITRQADALKELCQLLFYYLVWKWDLEKGRKGIFAGGS